MFVIIMIIILKLFLQLFAIIERYEIDNPTYFTTKKE